MVSAQRQAGGNFSQQRRDPRAVFLYAKFSKDVREVADVKEGMALEGTVTNVTNFGAFVDIGVHQDDRRS
jgi:uncharacterized protein